MNSVGVAQSGAWNASYNGGGPHFKSCGKIRLQACFILLRALRVLRGDIHTDCLPGASELRNLRYKTRGAGRDFHRSGQ